MKSVANSKGESIAEFLKGKFDAAQGYSFDEADFPRFAEAAKLLSDTDKCRHYAREVSLDLHYKYLEARTYKKHPGKVFAGAFSRALSKLAEENGFNRQILVLPSNDCPFDNIVHAGHWFRDLVSPQHGEYTHAIQWAILARMSKDRIASFDAAQLYKRTVCYKSKDSMDAVNRYGQFVSRKATIWDWLVDCFPESSKNKRFESYEVNCVANSYRCPQFVTADLAKSNNTGLNANVFLPAFVAARLQKGLDIKKAKGRLMRGRCEMESARNAWNGSTVNRYSKKNGFDNTWTLSGALKEKQGKSTFDFEMVEKQELTRLESVVHQMLGISSSELSAEKRISEEDWKQWDGLAREILGIVWDS